jgi:preprotein translocase subunit SecY
MQKPLQKKLQMLKTIVQIWKTKDLRKRILFTIAMVVIFRFLAQITIPGANLEAIRTIFQQNAILGVFSALTGGSAENFSIILLGLSPYINASIIMQLLTVIIPKFESLSKEGEQGQKMINRYTKWLTVPLAFLQSYGLIILMNSQSQLPILPGIQDPAVLIPTMITLTAGAVFLVWIGEIMTEYGIGNGISILIFAGIISSIPQLVGQGLFIAQGSQDQIVPLVSSILFMIVLLVIIVLVTEGQRRVPVTYSSHRFQGRGEQSFIPIRILQAGMIPIIFAVSLVSVPNLLSQFMARSDSQFMLDLGRWFSIYFAPTHWVYLVTYFLFIVAFTYFYVSITFNPTQVSENIQKRGGFVPGIRPGKQTADFLGKISNRLNLFGGVFLAIVAILPILFSQSVSSGTAGSITQIIGGAGLIIIVGVVLEIVRQVNTQLIAHDYEKLV